MGKHKNTIFVSVIILAVLAVSLLWSGKTPAPGGEEKANVALSADEKIKLADKILEGSKADEKIVDKKPEKSSEPKNTDKSTEESKLKEGTNPKLNESDTQKPTPTPSLANDNTQKSDEDILSCTLTVKCDTLLANLDLLPPQKQKLVPKDGIIYSKQKVTFNKGESVFNILFRELKKNKIHFEFVDVPLYSSAYIEGINNIYEFDAGELSGWTYKVNDVFPNYGCSRYILKDGDNIECLYTCNLGIDTGGYNKYEE